MTQIDLLGISDSTSALNLNGARVENAFFRYKSIIGDRLRARHREAQETEARLVCNMLNRMTELGRPVSIAVGI